MYVGPNALFWPLRLTPGPSVATVACNQPRCGAELAAITDVREWSLVDQVRLVIGHALECAAFQPHGAHR